MDLVGMTRAHIADPHIVNKLKEGREDEIRPCVGAGYCIDRIYNEGEMLCITMWRPQENSTLITSRRQQGVVKVVVVRWPCRYGGGSSFGIAWS